MPEDTAVLDAGTVAEAPEAPPPYEPETATEDFAPETDAYDETPETEDADPLSAIDPAIVERLTAETREKLDAEYKARHDEALRRQRESLLTEQRERAAIAAAEARYQQEQQIANEQNMRALIGGIVQNARKAAQEMDPDSINEETLAPVLQQVYTGLNRAVLNQSEQAVFQTLNALGIPQIHPQFDAMYRQARAQGDQRGMAFAMAQTIRAYSWHQSRQALEAETAAQKQAQDATAAEVAQVQKVRKTAAQLDRTTPPRGAPPRGDARGALDSAVPGTQAYREAFRKVHGIDPPF